MAIRFSKRIKIAPGVRLNVGKTGVSTTVGARGASVNVGKQGTHVNASLPGTGLSVRKKVGGRKAKAEQAESASAGATVAGVVLGFGMMGLLGYAAYAWATQGFAFALGVFIAGMVVLGIFAKVTGQT